MDNLPKAGGLDPGVRIGHVELYRDRPRTEWPRDAEGNLAMFNRPLDLEDLLGEAPGAAEEG